MLILDSSSSFWIRYSNAAALREDDLKPAFNPKTGKLERQNGSRGMALKILNVAGDFLELDNGNKNQDFLMINTPEFIFPDVRNYLRLNKLLLQSRMADNASPFFAGAAAKAPPAPPFTPPPPPSGASPEAWQEAWSDFDDEKDGVTTRESLRVLQIILSKTVKNPVDVQYFGAAPFLFGPDRAMKFAVAPCMKVNEVPFTDEEKTKLSKGYLRKAVTDITSRDGNICLNFQIQVRAAKDLVLPDMIENSSTTWGDKEVDNYVNVARIEIPTPQEPDSQDVIERCEKLAFSPWHSLAAHQPIGGINRVRQKVYYSSAKHRGAVLD